MVKYVEGSSNSYARQQSLNNLLNVLNNISLAKSSSAVINDKANDDKKQKDNSKDFATLFKMLEGCCLYMKPYAPIFNSIFSTKNAEESRINTNARKIDGESSIIEGVEYSVNND